MGKALFEVREAVPENFLDKGISWDLCPDCPGILVISEDAWTCHSCGKEEK